MRLRRNEYEVAMIEVRVTGLGARRFEQSALPMLPATRCGVTIGGSYTMMIPEHSDPKSPESSLCLRACSASARVVLDARENASTSRGACRP